MRILLFSLVMAVFLFAIPTSAVAYIGPGAGAGAIAIVLGVIASIFLALVAILWYPFKRLFRGWKAPAKKTTKT